jgi:acetyl-CoA carboxylase alpha subunit
MSLNFLDFEQPIAELEAKIDSLTAVSRQDEKLDINIDEEVHRLREKSVELTRKIFADLGAWQVAQLARHPRVRTPWIMSAWRLTNLTNWQATALTLTIKLSSAVSRVWTVVR